MTILVKTIQIVLINNVSMCLIILINCFLLLNIQMLVDWVSFSYLIAVTLSHCGYIYYVLSYVHSTFSRNHRENELIHTLCSCFFWICIRLCCQFLWCFFFTTKSSFQTRIFYWWRLFLLNAILQKNNINKFWQCMCNSVVMGCEYCWP